MREKLTPGTKEWKSPEIKFNDGQKQWKNKLLRGINQFA
jgi:hypothetical protein